MGGTVEREQNHNLFLVKFLIFEAQSAIDALGTINLLRTSHTPKAITEQNQRLTM
tara:strand:+ start:406 stop:570 length:165 start_codon:yes stop_codon:yes gene_type:complete